MPEIVDCPECHRKLRVGDEMLGRKVRCPSCGHVFLAGGTGGAPADAGPTARREQDTFDDEDSAGYEVVDERGPMRPHTRRPTPPDEEDEEADEEERPARRSRGRAQDWKKVQTGVTLVLIWLCLLIVLMIAGGIAGAVTTLSKMPRPGPRGAPAAPVQPVAQGPLPTILGIVAMGVEIVALVGYYFCLAVPPRTGARGLAMTALTLASCNLVMGVVSQVWYAIRGPAVVPGAGMAAVDPLGVLLGLLGLLLFMSKLFVFLFFLRAVAESLRAWGLSSSIKYLMIVCSCAAVGFVAVMVLGALVGATAPELAKAAPAGGNPPAALGVTLLATAACGCIDFILGLTAFVWYIVVLALTRSEIGSYLSGA